MDGRTDRQTWWTRLKTHIICFNTPYTYCHGSGTKELQILRCYKPKFIRSEMPILCHKFTTNRSNSVVCVCVCVCVCVWGITFGVISKSENNSQSHTWNSDLHGLYPNRASELQIWSYDWKHWYGMSYSRHVFPTHLWVTGKYTMCRFSHRLHSANTAQHIAKMSSLTSFEAQMFPVTQALFSTVHWKLMEASLTTTYVLKLLVQHRLLTPCCRAT